MSSDIDARVERAKELLNTIKNASMATVNDDGSPHNTPYFFMRDANLEHLYWASSPLSQHSLNINRTGQLFVVLYEANQGGGLFIQAAQSYETKGDELRTALNVYNMYRQKDSKDPLPQKSFESDAPQRMYIASVQKLWVNVAENDVDGKRLRDYRHEINREDIL